MRKEEEQKAAALGNLMRARDDLRGKLKSMGVDLNPPGQEKKGT
jgi:hypothetical protein